MAKKLTKNKQYHWFTTALAITWHVIFFGFLAISTLTHQLLGLLSWQLYLILLTFLSITLLMVYFLSLVDAPRPKKWNFWFRVNCILMCLPLYFLWWNFLQ